MRAVGRALEILLAFTEDDPELSAGALLKRVDLSRPTLYRLLYTLEESGFLVSVGEPQRFRLGPAVAKLSHVWKSTLDVGAVAEPVLRRIWQATSETVALHVLQGNMRVCVAELPSPQPLNFKRGVGHTERIVRGATGRAILAYLEPTREQLRVCAQGTDLDLKELESELSATRKRGYSTSRSELIPGAVAVAAPFFDSNGRVAGSIGVFGPEVRLDAGRQKAIANLILEESLKLSEALGFGKPGKPAR
ncbi:IclR family transcriptional regulator [Ramlibacter sp.]|uniref:IclR family transcriptional regulator n=1 Tax=Ramlibacter sp. TaxID=1917967 RepID=UPI00260785DC|nr:IclR family transcriptional regulator [Ramlibacter sp.]